VSKSEPVLMRAKCPACQQEIEMLRVEGRPPLFPYHSRVPGLFGYAALCDGSNLPVPKEGEVQK
jgi:hypothetical protein